MTELRHLVFSGGGPVLLQILGSLDTLIRTNRIHPQTIQSMWATSSGAIAAILLCILIHSSVPAATLQATTAATVTWNLAAWETICNYVIDRPWQTVFRVSIHAIFDAYSKKGIYDSNTFQTCFAPIFQAHSIPIDISLQDFYDNIAPVDLHMFAFDTNAYELVDISRTSYPDIPVLQALQMTCGIPILISPVFVDTRCFIDGGLSCNCPLTWCLSQLSAVDLPTGKSQLRESKVDLPTGKSQLRESKVDLPTGKAHLRESKVDLPTGKSQLRESKVDLPTGKAHLRESKVGLRESKDETEENVLVFKNSYLASAPASAPEQTHENIIHSQSTIVDFLLSFLFKSIFRISTEHLQPTIPHEIINRTQHMSLRQMQDAISSAIVRKELFSAGQAAAAAADKTI